MNKSPYRQLLSIKDKDELQKVIYSFSLEDRLALISKANFFSNALMEHLIENGAKLFTEDEFNLHEKKIISFCEAIDERIIYVDFINNSSIDFYKIIDGSEEFFIDLYFKYDLEEDKIPLTISNTKNLKLIIDKIGFDSFISRRFHMTDEIKEYLLINYKVPAWKKDALIASFKSTDYIQKYIKKSSTNKDVKDTLARKLPDELLVKYIQFPSLSFVEKVKNLKSNELKEQYLNKYGKLLPKSRRIDIITSFSSVECLKKYLDLFKTEQEKFELIVNSRTSMQKPKILIDLLNTIQSQKLLYKIYTESGWFGELALERIQNTRYIDKLLSDYGSTFPEHFYKMASEGALKKHVEVIFDMEYMKTPMPFVYIKDTQFVIEHLAHTQFKCEYSDKYYPLIQSLSAYYGLNIEHFKKLLEITGCSILSLVSNNNIRNLINLDEENFEKYIKLFDKDHIEATQSSMSSILNAIYSKKFITSFPQLNLIFSSTLHDIERNNIEMAAKRIKAVLGYVNEKTALTPDAIISGVISGNNDIINEYKRLCNLVKVSKRNDFVRKCIDENIDQFTTVKYDINPLIKEIFSVFSTDLIKEYIKKISNKHEIENPILDDDRLLSVLIDFKKDKSIVMSDADRAYVKDFNILLKEVFSSSKEFCFDKFNGLEGLPKQKLPIHSTGQILSQIIMNIDPLMVKDTIFTDDDLYKKLLEYIDTYRPLSWVETYGSKLSDLGFDFYEDLSSAIINYFALFQSEKTEALNNGKRMTLAEELDMFDVFASDANIYSYILGEEDYKFIRRNQSPNSSVMSKDKRLSIAMELIKKMHNRSEISVPPIDKDFKLKNGKMINIMLGNTNDAINLTYGERTGACMRIGGAGEELFDYCLLNPNGFHISFNNPETGKLVSRVSCYRNGNTVFLNEVRDSLSKEYTNNDIIEATTLIGQEIIKATANSAYPVENVVTSQHYAFMESDDEIIHLPCSPIKGIHPPIYTDIRKDNAILVASSSKGDPTFKLNPKNCESYSVGRSKIKKYSGKYAKYAVGHIETLDKHLSGVPLDEISTEFDDFILCFAGEDWYVTIDTNLEVKYYVQKNSRDSRTATGEMNKYLDLLRTTVKEKIKECGSDTEHLELYLESINDKDLEMEGSGRHA